MTRFGWWTMALLSVGVALYAIAVLLVPGFGAPIVGDIRANTPLALWAHLGGSWIALLVGPLQLNGRLRNRAIELHRWLGRSYVIGVLIGGAGGLALAVTSNQGIVTHLGFGALAVGWLFCTIQGYRAIRGGDEVVHRAWMMRSFALTFAAVMLRIIPNLSPGQRQDALRYEIALLRVQHA
jgi:uncharacterized membrane protein